MALTVTNGAIDVNMGLPKQTGLYVLGGGLVVFMIATYLLRRFGK